MSEVHLATLRMKVKQLRWMLNQAGPLTPEIFLQLSDDKVETFSWVSADVARSYCTFNNRFYRSLNLAQEIPVVAGINIDEVDGFLSHLDSNSSLEVKFYGSDEDHTDGSDIAEASWLYLKGDLNREFPILELDSRFDRIRKEVTTRFTRSNEYLTAKGIDVYPVRIRIPIGQLRKLVEVTDNELVEGVYPLAKNNRKLGFTIRDSEVKLVPHESVGPDFTQYYPRQFKTLVGTMSGDVVLSTHPDEKTLVLVQLENRGCVLRHTINAIDVPADGDLAVV